MGNATNSSLQQRRTLHSTRTVTTVAAAQACILPFFLVLELQSSLQHSNFHVLEMLSGHYLEILGEQ